MGVNAVDGREKERREQGEHDESNLASRCKTAPSINVTSATEASSFTPRSAAGGACFHEDTIYTFSIYIYIYIN